MVQTKKNDMYFGTKTQFVEGLRQLLHDNSDEHYRKMRGDDTLFAGLILFFSTNDDIPEGHMAVTWWRYLDKYLVDAFTAFRTKPEFQHVRERFKAEMGEDIPDLLDIRGGSIRLHVTASMARAMPFAVEDNTEHRSYVRHTLEEHFNAECTIVTQAWWRFVQVCYRGGLYAKIRASDERGFNGTYGRTKVRGYEIAGRIMFTFARPVEDHHKPDLAALQHICNIVETPDQTAETKLAAIEAVLLADRSASHHADMHEVTFVADSSDAYGCRGGMNFTETPYAICVDMIDEVVRHWDLARFVVDRDVSLR